MQVDTIKIKAGNERGYRIINASDFNPEKHEAYEQERPAASQTDAERQASEKLAAERKAQANFGQVDGGAMGDPTRNPSGTYSEPTPTDIRYPDKLATEFENNVGAFVDRSAAGLRAEMGLPDAPGGIKPEVVIPDDWEDLHWKQQVALAEQISGRDDIGRADEARRIIAAEIETRASSAD